MLDRSHSYLPLLGIDLPEGFDFPADDIAIALGIDLPEGFDFPADDIAIAIACFWGYPFCISARILAEIVFCEEPFFIGITSSPS